ncbi:MAG: hypothetical protein CVU54_00725 [Deltaproteobacteria bacterium HGW-Deltaproteobacteria-12]|nr:MAG: hypothetical protein CVU54_00725 [Deltaproteobacteria bacterium HGW-Deltaproteobacteria-12]
MAQFGKLVKKEAGNKKQRLIYLVLNVADHEELHASFSSFCLLSPPAFLFMNLHSPESRSPANETA